MAFNWKKGKLRAERRLKARIQICLKNGDLANVERAKSRLKRMQANG